MKKAKQEHNEPSYLTATKVRFRRPLRELLPTITFILILCVMFVVLVCAAVTQTIQQHQREQALVNILQLLSTRDSGSTYDEFISNVLADPPDIEVIAVFDQKGNKLIECTGNEYTVSLPEDALTILSTYHHLTHVHTHPKHDDSPTHIDSAFSTTDLIMPFTTGLGNHLDTLTVVSNKTVYSLERNGNDWPTLIDMDLILCDIATRCGATPEDMQSPEKLGKLLEKGGYGYAISDNDVTAYENDPKYIQVVADHLNYNFRISTS